MNYEGGYVRGMLVFCWGRFDSGVLLGMYVELAFTQTSSSTLQ
jgi:hypothetical protein